MALCARAALARGVSRVLIVDWDVHHGQVPFLLLLLLSGSGLLLEYQLKKAMHTLCYSSHLLEPFLVILVPVWLSSGHF